MTEPIGLQEARTLLAKAVETQGRDFVYNPTGAGPCYNVPYAQEPCDVFPEDSPKRKTGCLVGTALKLSGKVSEEELQKNRGAVAWRWSALGVITNEAALYFAYAQRMQDGGSSWGESYDYAESRLPDIRASGWTAPGSVTSSVLEAVA